MVGRSRVGSMMLWDAVERIKRVEREVWVWERGARLAEILVEFAAEWDG